MVPIIKTLEDNQAFSIYFSDGYCFFMYNPKSRICRFYDEDKTTQAVFANSNRMDGMLMASDQGADMGYDRPDVLYFKSPTPQGPFVYVGARSYDTYGEYHNGASAPQVIRYTDDGQVYFLTAMYNTEAAAAARAVTPHLPFGYGVYLIKAQLNNFTPVAP